MSPKLTPRDMTVADQLYGALREMVGPKMDLTNLPCHVGICPPEQCGRCSLELRARAAMERYEREGS